ncbi:copper amine oxidase 1 [Penicillium malachiteum]|uniref:copper amine oxidase 1 n=1 Tax=Penicillium malachiteum TaxID=1324776 RepID=UPI00254783CE|nr:copper amine oxidase 1 [Penicillium malachiteum]KAJ5729156.1 copper amine oxidase 1 [Penicillium malachiteum]
MARRQPHPFDPLSPAEISQAAHCVKDAFPNDDIAFRVVTLFEPAKTEMIPFLEAEHAKKPGASPPRRTALVHINLNGLSDLRALHVDLNRLEIIHENELQGHHSYQYNTKMRAMEKACLAAPEVQAMIKLLELPENAAVNVECWTFGTDGMNDMSERIIMCYLYMSLSTHVDSNHYAYPLDICVEMRGDRRVKRVLSLPLGENDRMSLAADDAAKIKPFDRRKIHGSSEYHPDLVTERRTTTKPYQVVQPDGSSFQTDGNLLTWEKWRLRREGLTLHDITYDGRSLFYRLALSEMFVPYGDSRAPYPRKAAFDLGSNGAGVNANNLKLGCDCLGHIKYFDGYHQNINGDPIILPSVVCCHEIDDGILWKHTNFRTNNAVVTRSRVLFLQTMITVGNYEYIFAFQFTQDASINYEVRATGILSTAPINLDQNVPYGTLVAPGVMAPYHQHLFSLRIDPAIDGHKNSLMVEESHAMPINDPAVHNPFGIGYTTTRSIVKTESPLDLGIAKGRVFKIVNEHVLNGVTGGPVGYKLVPQPSQMILAHPSSYHFKPSESAEHAIWVTRYHDGELYSAGEHTMQSLGGEGIASWIRDRTEPLSVRNEDLVVWHTFGTTHNPRVEDWPVMPVEKMMVSLKPVNFFSGNPALDVAVSTQVNNQSVLVEEKRGVEAEISGECCPRL